MIGIARNSSVLISSIEIRIIEIRIPSFNALRRSSALRNKRPARRILLLVTRRTAVSLLAAAGLHAAARLEIRGMYSSPKPFWDAGLRLPDFGINAIFVHAGSINAAMIERAAAEGARVFAEFPTLNGKGYVEEHPEAWPIDETGARSPAATWFLGACPSDPGFHAHRVKLLEDLLDRHAVAGVWLDYLHWHAQFEDPKPVLPETCFNNACISAFEKSSGVRVAAGETAARARVILSRHERAWRDWRARRLAAWTRDCREIVRRKRPGALTGIFHCPWTDSDFNGARRRTLGLDFDLLARQADVFSPMVYHGRMGRAPAWVGENLAWLGRTLSGKAKIWPIVQAHEVPAAEFETALRLGAASPATGVMMFTAGAVAADPAKREAVRRIYRDA